MSQDREAPPGGEGDAQAQAARHLHARLTGLLAEARHLPEGDRDAWLDRECAGDDALRERARILLRHAGDDALDTGRVRVGLADAAVQAAADEDDDHFAGIPDVVGRYRVVGRLGRGGMGIVLEAEQDTPRRRVALKILRSDVGSRDVVRRFEHEAEVLGQLQHPGIAQVLEAGIARRTDGTPLAFIAMELVRGRPITEHARGQDVARRLELLAATCDAVQHAHARGFIHRDLKPGNILVDDAGRPKVLDFGIARATRADVRAATVHTRVGDIIGTLPYMSPEQASGDTAALDIRSDVYALGVLAFELLAERLPLLLEALSLSEAVRVVREVEPARLGTIDRRLRGDVETIVAKALHKSPGRRYQSAGEMAEDIRRHLRGDSIIARPAGTGEQLARFARRHVTFVVAITIVVVAVIVGGVLLDRARRREMAQRRQADANAAAAVEANRAASRLAYFASIASGLAKLENAQIADARRNLEAAPAALRGWEWRHATSRLDDSIRLIDVTPIGRPEVVWPEPGTIFVFGGDPLQRRVHAWSPDSGAALARIDAPSSDLPRLAATWRRMAIAGLVLPKGGTDLVVGFDDGSPPTRLRLPACDEQLLFEPLRDQPEIGFVRARRVEGWIDLATGRSVLRRGVEHWTAAMDAAGTRIAWDLGDSRLASIHDATTLATLSVLRGHSQSVWGVGWLPGDREVVTGGADGTLRRWDASTGKELAVFDVGQPVTCLAVGDGILAVGLRNGLVRLVDPADGGTLAELHGGSSSVLGIAFDPKGGRMVSSEQEGAVRIWPVVRRDPRLLARHGSFAYDVQAIPGSHVVVTAAWDGEIRFVDARDGELLATHRCDDESPAFRAWSSLVAAPDGRWIAAGGTCHGPRVLVLDATTGATLADLEGRDRSVAVAGGRLLSAAPDGTLTSWRTDDWSLSARRPMAVGVDQYWPTMAGHPFLPLFAVDTPQGLALVDASSLESAAAPATDGSGRPLRAQSLAWTKDGRFLAVGVRAGELVVLDGRTLKATGTRATLREGGYELALSPDGSRLAAGIDDGTVHLFEWPSLDELAVLRVHANYVRAVDWLPDGAGIVTASGDGTVRSWTTWPLREQLEWQRVLPARRRELEPIVRAIRQRETSWEDCAAALRRDAAMTEDDRELALEVVTSLAASGR